MLCATGPGRTEPDAIGTTTTPADRSSNQPKDLPENLAGQDVLKETGGRWGRVMERGWRGRVGGRGRGRSGGTPKEGVTRKGTGEKLAQLVTIEVDFEVRW